MQGALAYLLGGRTDADRFGSISDRSTSYCALSHGWSPVAESNLARIRSGKAYLVLYPHVMRASSIGMIFWEVVDTASTGLRISKARNSSHWLTSFHGWQMKLRRPVGNGCCATVSFGPRSAEGKREKSSCGDGMKENRLRWKLAWATMRIYQKNGCKAALCP